MTVTARPLGATATRLDTYELDSAVSALSGMPAARHRLALHYLVDRGPGTGARYAITTSEGVLVEAAADGTLPVWTLDGRTEYRVPAVALAGLFGDKVDLAKAIRPFSRTHNARHAEALAWFRRA